MKKHLGSSWITDHTGYPIQFLRYLPYGEPQVDQRASWWNSPFTFSGKEKDEETGYSYFGARYYWDQLGIWMSVDPLAHLYPHQSPYMYCSGNPINRIDPTGMNDGEYWRYNTTTEKMEHVASDNTADNKNYILKSGGDPQKLNTDNYELYPTDGQRAAIGKHWDNYTKTNKIHQVQGVDYIGNYFEESGVGSSQGDVIRSQPGVPVYHTTFGQNLSVEALIPDINNLNGTINLIYHFHPTASMEASTSQNVNNVAAPQYLFLQNPSSHDYNVANANHARMSNQGTLLQISKASGVNFYNGNGVTLTIPMRIFRKPFQSIR